MTDLRQDTEVRSTLQEMGLSIDQIWKMGDGDLAFFMRNKVCLLGKTWTDALLESQPSIKDGEVHWSWWFEIATPEQWIRALVKAWKGAKE